MKKIEYFKTEFGIMSYCFIKHEEKKDTLILLHGWNKSMETFEEVTDYLKDKYSILLIDFLGFGKSEEPNKAISVKEYCFILHNLISYLDINNPIILGHSFGGRVAIFYASKFLVQKLILVNSAGIINRGLKFYLSLIKYKIKKNFYKLTNKNKYQKLIKTSGSTDYKNASLKMKEVLKKVTKHSLKRRMKKIKAKTLIIGGLKDETVSFLDSLLMRKYIKNSTVKVFFNSGHFSYIDEASNFLRTVTKFIEEE